MKERKKMKRMTKTKKEKNLKKKKKKEKRKKREDVFLHNVRKSMQPPTFYGGMKLKLETSLSLLGWRKNCLI